MNPGDPQKRDKTTVGLRGDSRTDSPSTPGLLNIYPLPRLSSLYRQTAETEKERATDLLEAADYCEQLARELVILASHKVPQ